MTNETNHPNRRRGLAILGATGSVGSRAVEVAKALGECFSVELLTNATQGKRLVEMARDCKAKERFCVGDASASTLPDEAAVCELLASPRIDVVLCAVPGLAALPQVLAALEVGKTVALASKEILVSAGAWVMETARRHNARLLPVDSEHCAIFQCLEGHSIDDVERLILTCSGGPFHAHPEVDLKTVTPEQALRHPTWQMGPKVTLDCATLMNKAFELIEAAHLYGVSEEQLQVVVHPQALVHSMVAFRDGAILAQMGPTDMRLPIQYCLTWPERRPALMAPLSFDASLHLDFLPPDTARFPALDLGRRALRMGGLAGAVLNAANDFACKRFLFGTLPFDAIPRAAAAALDAPIPSGEADSFAQLDRARRHAENIVMDFIA